jgi:hypothetical protein
MRMSSSDGTGRVRTALAMRSSLVSCLESEVADFAGIGGILALFERAHRIASAKMHTQKLC